MILAGCSYNESKEYKSKIVLVSEEETSKKQEEVLLNIVTDNPNEVLIGGLGVAKCMTTRVSPTYCPEEMSGNIFRLYDFGEDLSSVEEEVDGVVPLLVVPDGYSDMRELVGICEKYPRLRILGGNLLEIDGVRIGRYDKGKEKMSAVFNGVYDIFREVNLCDISVQKVMSKVRSKSSKSGSSQKKSVSKAKKTDTFSKFFGGEAEEF